MKVPPARLSTIELTKSGASLIPMPMPIPVDSINDRPKKMRKMAFFDFVWCCPRETPREITAAAWCRVTPIIRFTKVEML